MPGTLAKKRRSLSIDQEFTRCIEEKILQSEDDVDDKSLDEYNPEKDQNFDNHTDGEIKEVYVAIQNEMMEPVLSGELKLSYTVSAMRRHSNIWKSQRSTPAGAITSSQTSRSRIAGDSRERNYCSILRRPRQMFEFRSQLRAGWSLIHLISWSSRCPWWTCS